MDDPRYSVERGLSIERDLVVFWTTKRSRLNIEKLKLDCDVYQYQSQFTTQKDLILFQSLKIVSTDQRPD